MEPETAPVAAEAGSEKGSESPGAGMTRDKLIEMGFSEEDADWAVQQAKEQEGETVEPAAEDPADVSEGIVAAASPTKDSKEAVGSAAQVAEPVAVEQEVIVSEAAVKADVEKVTDISDDTPEAETPVDEDQSHAATEHSEPPQLETEPEEVPATETAVPSSADEQGPAEDAALEAEVPAEEEVPAVAEESHPVVQASPPAFKGVANSPPAKLPAVKASPAPAPAAAPTVCLRRAGCTCEDCAAMSGLSLKELTLATECPVSSPAKEREDEEPAATEHSEPPQLETEPEEVPATETAVPSSADEQGPAEDAALEAEVPAEEEVPAVAEESHPVVQASPPAFKGVANSPPAKLPAVKASPAPAPAAAPTVCLRRAGCTCEDCAAMSGLTLAAVSQCTTRSLEEDTENEMQQEPERYSRSTKTPVKTPGATKKPRSSIKPAASTSAVTSVRLPPKASSPVSSPAKEREDEEPAATEPEEVPVTETAVPSSADEQEPAEDAALEAEVQASPPAFKGVANSPPAKLPAVKASPAPAPAAAPTVCLRRAGCTCEDCAAMSGMSLKELTLATECPVSSPAREREDEEPAATEPEEVPATETAVPSSADEQGPAEDAALEAEVPAEEEVPAVAEESHPVVQASPPAFKGVANSPPAKLPAVKASPAPAPAAAPTVCLRRAGCTCEDCAAMSGLSLKELTLATECPVSSPAKEREDEEPAATEPEEVPATETAVPSSADEQGPAEDAALEAEVPAEEEVPAVAEESHPVVQASPPAFKGVANSPPAKLPAVKASPAPAPAAAPTVCLRRAGCTCEDCAAMSGLTLAAVSQCTTRSLEEDKENEVHKTPVKTPVAKKPPSSTKAATSKGPSTPARQPPNASPAPGPAAAVKESPASKGVANSPPAKLPAVKASPAPAAAVAPTVCLRRAGCTCVDCAAMAGLLALPAAPMQDEAQPVRSPAQAAPSSVKKSALNKSATKSVKQSPAFKAQPEFKLIASPAVVSKDESEVFSPEGFDNAEALNNILEDDGLEDFTDLRISAVNEAMRAEMRAALAQHEAEAARTAAMASVNAKPESTEDWMVLKLSAQGMAAAAAPSSSSNSSAARYTLEDVERISSFNMETLKKKMEAEISDLCRKLDEARKEAKSSTQALQDENQTLKSTMQEAEKTIDELVAVAEKEKKEAAMHLKSFTDMKSYADELETAFNGLHGRYTKLKEYYTASDSNNQV
jgi:hypothetical protein